MLSSGFAAKPGVIEKKPIINANFFPLCLVVSENMLTHVDDEHKGMVVDL